MRGASENDTEDRVSGKQRLINVLTTPVCLVSAVAILVTLVAQYAAFGSWAGLTVIGMVAAVILAVNWN